MPNQRIIDCRYCKKPFTPTHFNQRLCSDTCKSERNKKLCKQWDRNNKDKKRAYNARKYAESGDFYRNNSFRDRYGLTLDDAKALLSKQGGVCEICGEPIDLDVKGVNAPNKGHMDHCHKSGAVRGVLCRNCNWGLGNFRDSPELALSAASYLEKYNAK